MATFVLVSGAWHGSWCWERVAPLLTAGGHRVVAPDLLGMCGDPTPPETVTLAAWADQIAEILRKESEPVILVGHSRGGIVISETAEQVPDRIKTLVYLTAFILRDGETLAGVAAKGLENLLVPGVIVPAPDGTTTVSADAVERIFYNTTEAEWLARAIDHLCPEPPAAFDTTISLSADRYGQIPRAYIECTEDRALPIELQREMQANSPCNPVVTLNTDHSPFYSNPVELAAALISIAATLS